MTRQGRSASTVSTVLPKIVVPVRGGSGMTIACARIARASSMTTRAPWPGADLDHPPADAPPDEHPRALDDVGAGGLDLGQLGVERQRLRHGDRDEDVDAAAAARGEPGGGGDDLRREVIDLQRDEDRVVLRFGVRDGPRDARSSRS